LILHAIHLDRHTHCLFRIDICLVFLVNAIARATATEFLSAAPGIYISDAISRPQEEPGRCHDTQAAAP